jgi:hypothetical protein
MKKEDVKKVFDNPIVGFTMKIILFIVSLYFLFDYTDKSPAIDTHTGIMISVIATVLFAIFFIIFLKTS